MAASGDVTVAQDGAETNVRLHPYLVTLVRWCVSCVWSTATVLVHRLMMSSLQPITATARSQKQVKSRQAGTDHLHPEPRVECVVLHHPEKHDLDVIFVHGLYGSLGNTWRQGDWMSKYKIDPKITLIKDHDNFDPCKCRTNVINENKCNDTDYNVFNENDVDITFKNINEKLMKKIIPNDKCLITEQFYNNTLLDQISIVDNYETQADFVKDLFKSECDSIINKTNENNHNEYIINGDNKCKFNDNKCNIGNSTQCTCKINENKCKFNDNKCKFNDNKCKIGTNTECMCKINDNKCKINGNNECACEVNEKICEVGCGCICDRCYSTCWPRDWIREDFPGARVISINYTSDPYLWRPLWIKENKRLRLHERASQMSSQLAALGVGTRPVVWVGHSKGGLFIKQIYCDAYESYLRMNQKNANNTMGDKQNCTEYNSDNAINHLNENSRTAHEVSRTASDQNDENVIDLTKKVIDILCDRDEDIALDKANNNNTEDNETNQAEERVDEEGNVIENDGGKEDDSSTAEGDDVSSIIEDERLSQLWARSVGFMFYSVPHRGSPLADIKTPVTARSIELLEICKDCPLVLDLHARWQRAFAPSVVQGEAPPRPVVRSLVETCRTLMSLLWLRIVARESADAGIGSLRGVSLDHREICKPSSRRCRLYTELTDLIRHALGPCKC